MRGDSIPADFGEASKSDEVGVVIEVGMATLIEASGCMASGHLDLGWLETGLSSHKVLKGVVEGRMLQLVQSVRDLLLSKLNCPLWVMGNALEILDCSLQQLKLSAAKQMPVKRSVKEDIIRTIAAHLSDTTGHAHSLGELCKRFHINEYDLKRGFRAVYNQTVMEFLRHERMLQARRLLQQGKSVLETAEAVGYSNPSHFARGFRLEFGVAPGQIAKLNR
ncbi:MAG: helix-turn-helix transcriptional regulator [Verrucomicrobia bacterium]|nr:helix-turn-helix transcriptional regulator [Verrucomicrobiota bacterium]